MTLTQLSQVTTADGDVITLFRTDEAPGPKWSPGTPHHFDGFRRRYVFSVEGKGASGWGAVGAAIGWKVPSTSSYQGRDTDAWEPDAVPVMGPWADADAYGDADTYPPITVRGATYRHGLYWEPAHPSSGQTWRVDGGSLSRVDGEITDAGRRRMWHILEAARDLFLALPNVETELTRNSLRGQIERQNEIVRKSAANAVAMVNRMNAL